MHFRQFYVNSLWLVPLRVALEYDKLRKYQCSVVSLFLPVEKYSSANKVD